MTSLPLRRTLSVLFLFALLGCGGGGGDDDPSTGNSGGGGEAMHLTAVTSSVTVGDEAVVNLWTAVERSADTTFYLDLHGGMNDTVPVTFPGGTLLMTVRIPTARPGGYDFWAAGVYVTLRDASGNELDTVSFALTHASGGGSGEGFLGAGAYRKVGPEDDGAALYFDDAGNITLCDWKGDGVGLYAGSLSGNSGFYLDDFPGYLYTMDGTTSSFELRVSAVGVGQYQQASSWAAATRGATISCGDPTR